MIGARRPVEGQAAQRPEPERLRAWRPDEPGVGRRVVAAPDRQPFDVVGRHRREPAPLDQRRPPRSARRSPARSGSPRPSAAAGTAHAAMSRTPAGDGCRTSHVSQPSRDDRHGQLRTMASPDPCHASSGRASSEPATSRPSVPGPLVTGPVPSRRTHGHRSARTPHPTLPHKGRAFAPSPCGGGLGGQAMGPGRAGRKQPCLATPEREVRPRHPGINERRHHERPVARQPRRQQRRPVRSITPAAARASRLAPTGPPAPDPRATVAIRNG